METDHLIIGGGAAGMYAAVVAAESGQQCMIVEPNEFLGRKLRITGKGRCNVTNNCNLETLMDNIPSGGKFLYSAFSKCMPQDVMDFFEQHGVPLKTERGNRVFPVSDKAEDIVTALREALRKAKVQVVRGRVTKLLTTEENVCIGAILRDGTKILAKDVLVATGGMSYPRTGSTGDGYQLAQQVGHTITPLKPALVPLLTTEKRYRGAAGMNLRNVSLRLYRGKKLLYSELGEMQFTTEGVTGPMVLRSSSMMRKGEPTEYRLELDLKPGLTVEQLDLRLQREFSTESNRPLGVIFRKLMPAQLIVPFLTSNQISPERKANSIRKEERLQLVEKMKAVPLPVQDFGKMEEAIVTRGGIVLKEVNAGTMESKICSHLYFAGEILDLDGYTGGFNLQIAFATGYRAGLAMQESIM